MPDRPQEKCWNRIYRSQTGSQHRSALQHCRTIRWNYLPSEVSKCYVFPNTILLDSPAAEPSFAGRTAPCSTGPVVGLPALSDRPRTSGVSSATVSMIAKHMRNRRSKRHKRENGDLVNVRKGDQRRKPSDSPRGNAFCWLAASTLFVRTGVCEKEWIYGKERGCSMGEPRGRLAAVLVGKGVVVDRRKQTARECGVEFST